MSVTQWLPRRFSLAPADLLIVVLYLAAIIAIGFVVKRRAQRSIGSYFLGERQLAWWALAMSGSSSYFDITGTMWIVSLFVRMGVKGMWYQWMWGFPITAFYMAYMGPWIRRSGVMTGAEWMETRFGSQKAGECARLAYTIYAVLTITAFLAYGAVGMGKFGSVYMLGLSEHACAAWIIGLTGIYVILGGFRGVVLVEILQTVVLSCGALLIAYLGFARISWPQIAAATYSGWGSVAPVARLEHLRDTEDYLFGLLALTYVVKGLLLDFSGPEQLYDFQRFLAAKNPREASKLGALWGVVHTVRWPMAMAIAGMGVLGIINLRGVDPEKVLPIVLDQMLPVGLRGLAIAALLSGFLATFSSTVNGGASYLVRDIYHKYLRPQASQNSLIWAGYLSSALLIVLGIVIGSQAESIDRMFKWIMMTLGAGVLLPNVLRWYWWRLNGWGYAAGAISGMVLSLVQVLVPYFDKQPPFVTFPIIVIAVSLITVIVTYCTGPSDEETLCAFYRTVRPAGLWGPVAAQVLQQDPDFRRRPFSKDLPNVAIGLPCVLAMYTFPLYIVLHRWTEGLSLLALTLALCVVLYFTWYRKLPQIAEGDEEEQAPAVHEEAPGE